MSRYRDPHRDEDWPFEPEIERPVDLAALMRADLERQWKTWTPEEKIKVLNIGGPKLRLGRERRRHPEIPEGSRIEYALAKGTTRPDSIVCFILLPNGEVWVG